MNESRIGAGATPVTRAIGATSSCGRQVKSTENSAPFYGFGTATREIQSKRFVSNEHVIKDYAPKQIPGPGTYNQRVATGKQAQSTVPTVSSWKFGSQKRFDTVTKDRITATPGPGAYLV